MRHRKKQVVGKAHLRVAKTNTVVEGIVFNVREDLRDIMVEGGLSLLRSLLEEDVTSLCGARYAHGDVADAAYRWGRQPGVAVLGGQKVVIDRPRVRRAGKEVALSTYEAIKREDPLNERAIEQMAIGVSTRKYKRSVDVVGERGGRSMSRSAVSRRFIAMSQARLETALSAPLGDRQWAALMLDGIEFGNHVVIAALGIDSTGMKHVLGLREGTTENATLCRELLSDIVARGVPANRSLLLIIDGGKGLRKAVTQVFGRYALVQRCQVHKRRNVLEHLSDEKRAHVRHALEQAYSASVSADTAAKQLANLARSLKEAHPGAAASLEEGIDETLTIKRLGLSELLTRSLATTNAIENMNGVIRQVTHRVKKWRGGAMVLRWVATATFEAQRGFRRVRGHQDMKNLWQKLRQHDDAMGDDNVSMVG